MSHAQIDTDRSGNEIGIRVSPTSAIYRAGIHTRTTTDAIQCLDMIGLGKQCTPAVIYDNDMIFTAFAGTTVMGSVGGHRLSGSRTGKQSGEYPQCIQIRNNLFHTESGDVQLRVGSTHIGVSLIRADYNVAG